MTIRIADAKHIIHLFPESSPSSVCGSHGEMARVEGYPQVALINIICGAKPRVVDRQAIHRM
jgi:hypothetical protein